MKKDVFVLGLSQYAITAVAIGLVAKAFGGLTSAASIVVGGALSLSSLAFVLQLIKEKKELATRFGKASFGVLLLQDLGELWFFFFAVPHFLSLSLGVPPLSTPTCTLTIDAPPPPPPPSRAFH